MSYDIYLLQNRNAHFGSTEDCIETLSDKPFGSYDEVWGDNVVCRTIHILLAAIRPEASQVYLHT